MTIKLNWKNDDSTRFLVTVSTATCDFYGITICQYKGEWILFEPQNDRGEKKYRHYRFSKEFKKEIIDSFLDNILKEGE